MGVAYHFLPVFSLLAYGLSTWFYFGDLLNPHRPHSIGGRRVFLYALCFHVLFLLGEVWGVEEDGNRISSSFLGSFWIRIPQLGFPFFLSLLGCTLAGVYLLLEKKLRLSVLGAFIAPLVLLFVLFSAITFHMNRHERDISTAGSLLITHIFSALLGNVVLALAFGVSIAFLIQETLLKKKRFSLLQQKLPSLEQLDHLNTRLLLIGVFLTGAGILTGVLSLFQSDIPVFVFDIRFLWSGITLLVYGTALLAHFLYRFQGRRVAWITIVGFVALLASFYFVNFTGESFHAY